MDLKAYYRKIREAETRLGEDHPVIRSLATEAGGRAGVLTEVPRTVAAKMLVDGLAALASEEETAEFRQKAAEARAREEERRRAEQVQFTILSESDFRAIQGAPRRGRKG